MIPQTRHCADLDAGFIRQDHLVRHRQLAMGSSHEQLRRNHGSAADRLSGPYDIDNGLA
jgi:hypothetical protein